MNRPESTTLSPDDEALLRQLKTILLKLREREPLHFAHVLALLERAGVKTPWRSVDD